MKAPKWQPTIPARTKQELFDNALIGVRRQAWPSVTNPAEETANGETRFRYHLNDSIRCGIGWSIPSATYSVEIEGANTDDPIVRDALKCPPSIEPPFLSNLQRCHDGAYEECQGSLYAFLHIFEEKMERLAEANRLIYREPYYTR